MHSPIETTSTTWLVWGGKEIIQSLCCGNEIMSERGAVTAQNRGANEVKAGRPGTPAALATSCVVSCHLT